PLLMILVGAAIFAWMAASAHYGSASAPRRTERMLAGPIQLMTEHWDLAQPTGSQLVNGPVESSQELATSARRVAPTRHPAPVRRPGSSHAEAPQPPHSTR